MWRGVGRKNREFIDTGGPMNETFMRSLLSMCFWLLVGFTFLLGLIFMIIVKFAETNQFTRNVFWYVLMYLPSSFIGGVLVSGYIEIEKNSTKYFYHIMVILLITIFIVFGKMAGQIVSVVFSFLIIVKHVIIEVGKGAESFRSSV